MNFVLLGVAMGLICLSFFLWQTRKGRGSLPCPGENAGPQEGRLIDYGHYVLSTRERLLYTGGAAAVLFALAYVFYHSVLLSLLLTPLAYYYPRFQAKRLAERRRRALEMQFKDALYSLASSLLAGKSVELAFRDVHQDLRLLYPDPETPIIREVELIVRLLELNENLEDALADLAERAGSEDIDSFVDVFILSKRSGGNLVEIIRNTSAIIADKLQIQQEIETHLAQRKLEQKVLTAMPIAMILLLSWATGDYMTPVFTTWAGRVVMTFALILIATASLLARKIMTIEV